MKVSLCKIYILLGLALLLSCYGAEKKVEPQPKVPEKKDPQSELNAKFLKADPEAKEVFRVVLSSDAYTVAQMKNDDTIKRNADAGGDKYICTELRKFDKIDEVREGVISIWLYPDSGKLMKVRPIQLTYLLEIDQLLVDDIQRWTFTFAKGYIQPHQFEIKYRVLLRKKQSDREILSEIREKMKEKKTNR